MLVKRPHCYCACSLMSPSGCPQACVVWVRWRSLAVDVMHSLATGLYNQGWAPRRYWKNNDEDVAAPFWAQEIIPVSNWVPQLQCSIHWLWGYPTDESFCIQSSIVSQHTGPSKSKKEPGPGWQRRGVPQIVSKEASSESKPGFEVGRHWFSILSWWNVWISISITDTWRVCLQTHSFCCPVGPHPTISKLLVIGI